MPERQPIQPVENYTVPFLVSFCVLVFIGLFAIWAVWGLLMAAFTGWCADRCITFGGNRKLARERVRFKAPR